MSTGNLTSAVVELIAGLREAFDYTGEPDKEPAETRARFSIALKKIGLFLEDVPTIHDFAKEFLTLATALDDLNQGTVHPLLQPSKVTNRPPDSTEIWMARAKTALAVEILLRTGMTRTQVIDAIDKFFPAIIRFAKRGGKAGRAAMLWHTMFLGRKVKNRIAQKVFDQKLAESAAREDAPLAIRRDTAMQMLRQLVLGFP
jgi:hypothetical protein